MKERIRIGVVVYHLSSHYAFMLSRGIRQAAAEADADVFLFPGTYADDDRQGDGVPSSGGENTVYELAALCRPDVLIVSMGSIGVCNDEESGRRFLSHFKGTPVLVLETLLPGYRCLTIDSATGFAEALRHLIEDHGLKKIGYMDGKENNYDAAERKRIYMEMMRMHGLAVSDKQIVRGGFSRHCEEQVARLMDANPDLQAICCANDDMAVGAYREITRRGLRVGRDIALTGFDDSDVGSVIHPGLTTVRVPTYALGMLAVREALSLLRGDEQRVFSIDSVFIRRSTCGCTEGMRQDNPLAVLSFAPEQLSILTDTVCHMSLLCDLPEGLRRQFHKSLLDLIGHLCHPLDPAFKDPAAAVRHDLHLLLSDQILPFLWSEHFQMAINQLCEDLLLRFSSPQEQTALFRMRLSINRSLSSLMQDALAQENERLRRGEWLASHIVSDALQSSDLNMDGVEDNICRKVSQMGAQSCALYLFEQPLPAHVALVDAPNGRVRLAACCRDGVMTSPPDEPLLPYSKILQMESGASDTPLCAMVFSLYTGQEQLGFLLCRTGLEQFQTMVLAALQSSAALKFAHLMRERNAMLKTISLKNERLQILSTHDELTGILNRRGFLERVRQTVAQNSGQPAAIFFLDLNDLKIINDRFGHSQGDFALRHIAQVAQDNLRGSDWFGRIGGDEFAIFSLIPKEKTSLIVMRLRQAFRQADENVVKPFHIEASIGAESFICDPSFDPQAVLALADDRLYADKQNKRKDVVRMA